MTVTLRGGMVGEEEGLNNDTIDDETRAPSFFSYDVAGEFLEVRTTSGTSSLCSDNIPDLDPMPADLAQPAPMRRVTSATSVHATSTVIVTEPHQIVLSRAVAQEDADRRAGVVATNTTPALGPVRNLRDNGPDLAEYVDRHFGLDGNADDRESTHPEENRRITFREPDFEGAGTQEIIAPDHEVETEVDENNSRRLSAAVRNARSRLREFFPVSDVVTSSRASMDGHVSRTSRLSDSLRQVASQNNLLSRAASRIFTRDEPENFPTRYRRRSFDQITTPRDEGRLLEPGPDQRALLSQNSLSCVNEPDRASLPTETLSEPVAVVDRTHNETVVLDNLSQQEHTAATGQTMDDFASAETRTERQASVTSLMRRAVHRLSTTFTFGSRYGSHDETNAPPPTRDGLSFSRENGSDDIEPEQDCQGAESRVSRLGSNLRHIGSFTMDLARRAASRFSDASAMPTGGVLEPVVSEGPWSTNQEGSGDVTEYNVSGGRSYRARRAILPEWRSTLRRASAAARRRETLYGHGTPQAVEPEGHRHGDTSNEERSSQIVNRAGNAQGADPRQPAAGGNQHAELSRATIQAGGNSNRRSLTPLKTLTDSMRKIGRNEQNVFTI